MHTITADGNKEIKEALTNTERLYCRLKVESFYHYG